MRRICVEATGTMSLKEAATMDVGCLTGAEPPQRSAVPGTQGAFWGSRT